MDKPLISVMILAYNIEEYIEQSVHGALMQECAYSFEIVICDDCSTDNTRNICERLQQEFPDKIRLIFNEENKGVIRNYYETMAQCRGKYVADCSGDDYWIDPKKLQMQADILEKRNDVVLVFTNWKNYTEEYHHMEDDIKSNRYNTKQQILDSSDMKLYLNQKRTSLVNINSACFRKEETLKIRSGYAHFFNSKYPSEDFQLIFLMLTQFKIYYLDAETTVYRIRPHSLSKSKDNVRTFDYQYGMAELRFDLGKQFDVRANNYVRLQSVEFFKLAYKAKRNDLARKAKELIYRYGYTLSLKSKILYYFASNKVLTGISYPIFCVLKKLKQQIKS